MNLPAEAMRVLVNFSEEAPFLKKGAGNHPTPAAEAGEVRGPAPVEAPVKDGAAGTFPHPCAPSLPGTGWPELDQCLGYVPEQPEPPYPAPLEVEHGLPLTKPFWLQP